jgi:hypothetical protein
MSVILRTKSLPATGGWNRPVWVAILFSLFLAGCGGDPPPSTTSGRPSHYNPEELGYYLRPPTPGQAPDGTFPAKMKFRMVKEGKDYSLVRSVRQGLNEEVYVATDALKPHPREEDGIDIGESH